MSAMETTKFTSGPLIYTDDNGSIETADGTPIGQVFDNPGEDEGEANGVLFASAPDLYAALQSLASQKLTTEMDSPEDADFTGAYDEMVTIARNALKKANP